LCVRAQLPNHVVRDDKYGWAVVEKSTNHCVVRWVLNSFDFDLLSYKIIDMYRDLIFHILHAFIYYFVW
jgi:hypothetical protein